MLNTVRNTLMIGVTLIAFGAISPQAAQANDDYWERYYRWYDQVYGTNYSRDGHRGWRGDRDDYRRHRSNYGRRGYGRNYYRDYRRPNYYYGSRRGRNRGYYRGYNSINVGPLRLNWR